jgi:GNAT superfamily N-acetyltransferase
MSPPKRAAKVAGGVRWHYHPGPTPVEGKWCGEFWPGDEDTGHPWGVCWVAEYLVPGPTMLYLLVVDAYRRLGVGTALVAAARARWPGLWVTDGVTPEGEAFHAAMPADWRKSPLDEPPAD